MSAKGQAGSEYFMLWIKGGTPNVYVVRDGQFGPIGLEPSKWSKLLDGESLTDAYSRRHKLTSNVEPCLAPGKYFPRMYRPTLYREEKRPLDDRWYSPIERNTLASSLAHLSILQNKLLALFAVVEPRGESNLSAYGPEIRNLLILGATKVESMLRATVLENKLCKGDESRLRTSDYVQLAEPMRLREYAIEFPLHQGLGSLHPFKGWSAVNPTQSLDWYNAYNKVKHDQEKQSEKGTLLMAAEAVAACAVMVEAHFGPTALWEDALGSFIHFAKRPDWRPSQHYYTHKGENWSPTYYVSDHGQME